MCLASIAKFTSLVTRLTTTWSTIRYLRTSKCREKSGKKSVLRKSSLFTQVGKIIRIAMKVAQITLARTEQVNQMISCKTPSKNKKKYKCSFCDKSYTKAHSKTMHERKNHTGENLFKCSFCDKTFPIQCMKKFHEKSHMAVKPYKCTFCEKTFVWDCQRKDHERSHTGEKPYKCSYCNKAFKLYPKTYS